MSKWTLEAKAHSLGYNSVNDYLTHYRGKYKWTAAVNFGKRLEWIEKANTQLNDELINGILLGDGYLGNLNKKENSYLQLLQSKKHQELVFDFQRHLEGLGFRTGLFEYSHIRRNNLCHNIKVYSYRDPIFTNLRQTWYPNGVKIIPDSLKLTPLTLAYWFMADGSSYKDNRNTRVYTRFCTQGFDDQSVLKLKILLEKTFGFENLVLSRAKSNNGLMIEISKASEVNKLMKIIEPYMLSTFQYKIKYSKVSKSRPNKSLKTKLILKEIESQNEQNN